MPSGSNGSHAGPPNSAPAATPSAPSTSAGAPSRCGAAPPTARSPPWGPAVIEAARLEEVRSTAEEELAAAHLDCGEHHSVIASAEALVREQPLRERRWSLLATALYRSGRQADALAALRPPACGSRTSSGSSPARSSPPRGRDPAPRSLPRAAAPRSAGERGLPVKGLHPYGIDDGEVFFGRDADIAAVLARLDRAPFIAVSGPSGCGKSSLVLAGVVPPSLVEASRCGWSRPPPRSPSSSRRAVQPTQRRRRRRRPARGALPAEFPPTRCMRWVRSSPRRPRPGSWWRPCGPTSSTNAPRSHPSRPCSLRACTSSEP